MFKKPFLNSVLTLVAVTLLFVASPIPAADAGLDSKTKKQPTREEIQELIKAKKAQARRDVSESLKKELTPLEKDWGVKLYGVRWTASGYMLEMKFRVLDEHKAFPLLKRDVKRYLIVEKNGAVLEVPFTQKLGSLRSTVRTANMVKRDHNYVALFANPGMHVKRGEKVTLVIGNFIAENLTVQ